MKKLLILTVLLISSLSVTSALARDTISIVGSSTVYPFTTVVAERFGRNSDFKTPKIESTGTGGGMKLFCAGLGGDKPDMTNASRQIKASEVALCKSNGIDEIVEMKVGYDGIVIASDKEKGTNFSMTTKELFLALAKDVPDAKGKLIANPNTHWNQINAEFPATKIEILGPPPTSGTRDALAELALEGGAKHFEIFAQLRESTDEADILAILATLGLSENIYQSIKAKKGKVKGKDIFKVLAHAVREDGAYIEAGENDNLIIQKIRVNPSSLGIFGFSFLDQNSDVIRAHNINGVELSFESIAAGDYPIARSLYVYVKKQHVGVVPGMDAFLAEYTSENAWGEDGYLVDKGLIPMSEEERELFRSNVKNLVPLAAVK